MGVNPLDLVDDCLRTLREVRLLNNPEQTSGFERDLVGVFDEE